MLALFVSSMIAEERLTLSIGGELMERDMPQDIEEAQDLIRYLIDIANKADEKIGGVKNKPIDNKQKKINNLTTSILNKEILNKLKNLQKARS